MAIPRHCHNVKQFYIGGANSVRAFDARSLGPGSYKTPDSLAANSFVDQAGDIKLEANIEYRFPIVSIIRVRCSWMRATSG